MGRTLINLFTYVRNTRNTSLRGLALCDSTQELPPRVDVTQVTILGQETGSPAPPAPWLAQVAHNMKDDNNTSQGSQY